MGNLTRRWVSVFAAMSFLFSVPVYAEDTFFGVAETGFFSLPDYKYPVYLFIPDNYEPDHDYPFAIGIPDEGTSSEEFIQIWKGTAKRRSMILLVPTNLKPEDSPMYLDKWILRIKKDVEARYRVDRTRTYLVGVKEGAHYAAYLGVSYPEEFSGMALLGAAWKGEYEKRIFPKEGASDQLPVFIAYEHATNPSVVDLMKKESEIFSKKGYPVSLVLLKENERFSTSEFKKGLFNWLDEKSAQWQRQIHSAKKSWKEKFNLWLKRQFQV